MDQNLSWEVCICSDGQEIPRLLCKFHHRVQEPVTGPHAVTWIWFTLSGCVCLEIHFSIILSRPGFPNGLILWGFLDSDFISFLVYSIRATYATWLPYPNNIFREAEIVSLHYRIHVVCVTHPAFYPLGEFSEDKAAGSEAEDSSPSSAGDKNVWSYTSIPPHMKTLLT